MAIQIKDYNGLLTNMLRQMKAPTEETWALENLPQEMSILLRLRHPKLTITVTKTTAIPPVLAVPTADRRPAADAQEEADKRRVVRANEEALSTVTSQSVTSADVAQAPVAQTVSVVSDSQPTGGRQDAPANVLNWSKQDVKTALGGTWPIAKKPRTSGHKVGNVELLSYWYPLKETDTTSAYLVNFKDGDKFVVVTTETRLTASNVQSEGGLNTVKTKFDRWAASSEPISFYRPSNNTSNANKGLVLIK